MAISLKVEGMDSLKERMRGLADGDIHKVVQDVVQEWGTFAFNASQQACPVDTGILAESGEMSITDDGTTLEIRYTAPYASAVEYGWRRESPIVPVRKKALSWEPNRKGRLLAKGKPGNRVTVSKVIAPASFKGISYVRVPMRRAMEHLGSFFGQAMDKLKRGETI